MTPNHRGMKNPYSPPTEVESKKLKPFRLGNSGGAVFLLAMALAIVSFVAVEWLFYLDFYSYQVHYSLYWQMETLQKGVAVSAWFVPFFMAGLLCVYRLPLWAPLLLAIAWLATCAAWLSLFLRECVTRGGDNALYGMAALVLLWLATTVVAHRFSLRHHTEMANAK